MSFTDVEKQAINRFKFKGDDKPGRPEPGEYAGELVVRVRYGMDVSEDTTTTTRDGASSSNLEAALKIALSELDDKQRAKVTHLLDEAEGMSGKKKDAFVASHVSKDAVDWFEGRYPYIEKPRRGSISVEGEAEVLHEVEDDKGGALDAVKRIVASSIVG